MLQGPGTLRPFRPGVSVTPLGSVSRTSLPFHGIGGKCCNVQIAQELLKPYKIHSAVLGSQQNWVEGTETSCTPLPAVSATSSSRIQSGRLGYRPWTYTDAAPSPRVHRVCWFTFTLAVVRSMGLDRCPIILLTFWNPWVAHLVGMDFLQSGGRQILQTGAWSPVFSCFSNSLLSFTSQSSWGLASF